MNTASKVLIVLVLVSAFVYPFVGSVTYSNIRCNTDTDCPILAQCGTNNYLYHWRVCYNGYCVCDYGPGWDEPCDNFCEGNKVCHGYCSGSCGNAHCVATSCECNKYCGSECETNADCPPNYVCNTQTCKCEYAGTPEYHFECVGHAGSRLTCERVDGPGANECLSDSDCQPTHMECQNFKCVEVPGAGTDECSSDSDCLVTHKACVNNKCVLVSGAGTDECSTDSDCYSSTHTECHSGKCVVVSGAGANQCRYDSDCYHYECSYQNGGYKCVKVLTKGENECKTDSDCYEEFHTECEYTTVAGQVVAKCVKVSGAGTDECSTDSDCYAKTHLDCRDNKCVRVLGEGPDLCQNDQDCLVYHTECKNFRCVQVEGPGTNVCEEDSDCYYCGNCPDSCSCFLNYCYGYDDSKDCCVDAGYYWNGETCCGNDFGEKTPSDCPTGKVSEDCKLCCGYKNTPINPYVEINGKRYYIYNGDLGYGEATIEIEVPYVTSIRFGVENVEPEGAVGFNTTFDWIIEVTPI